MAKGIKKIEWTGKGEIVSSFLLKSTKLKIKADQFVYFKITEWHDGTTEQEKKKLFYGIFKLILQEKVF